MGNQQHQRSPSLGIAEALSGDQGLADLLDQSGIELVLAAQPDDGVDRAPLRLCRGSLADLPAAGAPLLQKG